MFAVSFVAWLVIFCQLVSINAFIPSKFINSQKLGSTFRNCSNQHGLLSAPGWVVGSAGRKAFIAPLEAFFGMGKASASVTPRTSPSVKQASRQLEDTIKVKLPAASTVQERRAILEGEVPRLIAQLEAAKSTFNARRSLYGPWKVLYVTGTSWQRYFAPFQRFKTDADGGGTNKSFQWFSEDGSFKNVGQFAGDSFYVTTEGTYSPASTCPSTSPYIINATVDTGYLHMLGMKLPLSFIKGNGVVDIMYSDDRLRVFRSEQGGLVIQVKVPEGQEPKVA